MPRFFEKDKTTTFVEKRTARMHLARETLAYRRADYLIHRALELYERSAVILEKFTDSRQVRFYHKPDGWRTGTATQIDPPTNFFTIGDKSFTTHEAGARPSFGNTSLSPDIRSKPEMTQETPSSNTELNRLSPSNTEPSKIISTMYFKSLQTNIFTVDLPVQTTVIFLRLQSSATASADSSAIRLTQTRHAKNLCFVTEYDRVVFSNAEQKESSFFLRQSVVGVPADSLGRQAGRQTLQWILSFEHPKNPKLKP